MRIARGGNRDTNPIGVGIAGNHEIGPSRLGVDNRRFERSGILRIGDVVRHVGKIAVGRALGGKDVYPAKTRRREHPGDPDVSPTPCRGV